MRHGTKVNNVLSWTALLALAIPWAAAAQARENLGMTERAAARALSDNRVTPERYRALALAMELGSHASPELRAAVIGATWAELRGETDSPPGSEALFSHLDAVVRLRDARAIPVLVEALRYGSGAANALADLGAVAFPAVLEAVANPGERNRSRVWNGVTTLRFMIEDGSLGPREVALVRDAARDRLSGTQDHGVVLGAMRLAISLGDNELRKIVEMLATDRAAAEALVSRDLPSGTVGDRDYRTWSVDSVQERAQLLLAGRASEIGPTRRPYPRR